MHIHEIIGRRIKARYADRLEAVPVAVVEDVIRLALGHLSVFLQGFDDADMLDSDDFDTCEACENILSPAGVALRDDESCVFCAFCFEDMKQTADHDDKAPV